MKPHDPYLPADWLGITESERLGLIRLAREIPYSTDKFEMMFWRDCICGHLARQMCLISMSTERIRHLFSPSLSGLFTGNCPSGHAQCWEGRPISEATREDAAIAITRFLTFGL